MDTKCAKVPMHSCTVLEQTQVGKCSYGPSMFQVMFLNIIKKHYLEPRMDIRVHKNTRRLPPRTLSFAEITSLIKFIETYAEQHAILLPGRIQKR